jgi:HAD superfamily hydrolase (TIGR01509 family)
MRLKVNEQAMATTIIGVEPSTSQASLLLPVFPWVILDMDGTLVDTFQLSLRSFNYAVRRFLRRPLTTEETLGIPGGTLEEQLTDYMPRGAVPRAVERYHAHYTHQFTSGTRVFPGIRGLLFTMRARGIKLAVCTGASRQIAEYTLARSGLSQFFSTVVAADDVNKPKPDPEGLRIAMETIGAYSDQTVYLGDHPNDIRASRKAGAKSGAARWGSMHRNELRDLKPDFLFKDPSEALTLSDFRIYISTSSRSHSA